MKNCATMWRGVLYCKVKIMEYTNVQRDIREKHPLFPWRQGGVTGGQRSISNSPRLVFYVYLCKVKPLVDYFCLNEEETGQMCWAGRKRDVWVSARVRWSMSGFPKRDPSFTSAALNYTTVCFHSLHRGIFNMDLSLWRKESGLIHLHTVQPLI